MFSQQKAETSEAEKHKQEEYEKKMTNPTHMEIRGHSPNKELRINKKTNTLMRLYTKDRNRQLKKRNRSLIQPTK